MIKPSVITSDKCPNKNCTGVCGLCKGGTQGDKNWNW